MAAPVAVVLAALVPLVTLTALVLARVSLIRSAWIATTLAALLAGSLYGLPVSGVGIAVLRGAWTGAWILLIVLPALLLFEILDRTGALDRLADAADDLAPTEGRRLLLLAWVFPSFLQGAAGFGAPIAMAAPMLVRRGMAPAAAVGACLIGYQWSVTFGSMGSSYFMAEATARLGAEEAASFALRSGVVLAVTAVVSGALVLGRGRRSSGDLPRMLAIGGIMGGVLVAVVVVQPALGSITAGLAGLVAAWWLLPARGSPRPAGADVAFAALPYVILTATAAIGFGLPPVRALLDRLPVLAPQLPGTRAAFGFVSAGGPMTPAFRVLLHPLVYVLFAVAVAVVVFRRRGWWERGTGRAVLSVWSARARRVSASIVGLTVLAAVLMEAGMISMIAEALAATIGLGFVVVSAPLGAFGTILTGSTTTSNALFSALQAEVAVALALAPALLLTAQTAGGNVGNALSPGVATVGSAAVGAHGSEGEVLRRNLRDVGLLITAVIVMVLVMVRLA